MGDHDPSILAQAMAASTTTIKDLKLALSHINHQIHAIYSGQNPAAIHMYESLQNTASSLSKDIEIEELKIKLSGVQLLLRGTETVLSDTRTSLCDSNVSLSDRQKRIFQLEVQNVELGQRVVVRGKKTEKAQQMCLELMLENEELKEEVEKLAEKIKDERKSGNMLLRDQQPNTENQGPLSSGSISNTSANIEGQTHTGDEKNGDEDEGENSRSERGSTPEVLKQRTFIRQAIKASKDAAQQTAPVLSENTINFDDSAWKRDPRVQVHVAEQVAEARDYLIAYQAKNMLDFEDPVWTTDSRIVAYLNEQVTNAANKIASVPQPAPINSQDTSQRNSQRDTEKIILQGQTYYCHTLIKEYVSFADTIVHDLLVFQNENMLNFMDPAWIDDQRICVYVAQKVSEAKKPMVMSSVQKHYTIHSKDMAWKNNPQVSAYVTERVSEARRELLLHQDLNMLNLKNPTWVKDGRVKSHVAGKVLEAQRELVMSQAEHILDFRYQNWMTDKRIVALVAERIAKAKCLVTTNEALDLVDFQSNAWKEHPKVFAYVLDQISDAEQQMTTLEALDMVNFEDNAWLQHPKVTEYMEGWLEKVFEGTERSTSVCQVPRLVDFEDGAWKKNPRVIAYVQRKLDRAKEHMVSYQRLNMVDFTHPTWLSHPNILTHIKEQIRQAEENMRAYQFLNMVDFKNPLWMKDRRITAYVRNEVTKEMAVQLDGKTVIEDRLESSDESWKENIQVVTYVKQEIDKAYKECSMRLDSFRDTGCSLRRICLKWGSKGINHHGNLQEFDREVRGCVLHGSPLLDSRLADVRRGNVRMDQYLINQYIKMYGFEPEKVLKFGYCTNFIQLITWYGSVKLWRGDHFQNSEFAKTWPADFFSKYSALSEEQVWDSFSDGKQNSLLVLMDTLYKKEKTAFNFRQAQDQLQFNKCR